MPMAESELTRIRNNHRLLLALCDQLERIADRLPDGIDRQECLVLARALGPALYRIQTVEETLAFPVLAGWQSLEPEMAETLERLRFEHQSDLCYAEEIQDMLRAYGEGRPSPAPDAAGFMLRGFFEGIRRHVAFERQALLPLAALMRHAPASGVLRSA
ncbi:hemerythrin domain-containing protein [Arsenicitalea aurantiaca]|nr:hemerythrin domain-containing protein [Arsenicitalea aurantiaca]